ncbi:MAG: diguanylate cyclase [Thermodesulfobacteriota bacterium]
MSHKKILVVDNNPVILRLMRGFLEKEGHEVRTASDGLSALYLLESFVPDVIFTDLVMPNIDGEKLCRIVRDMPALTGVYLVILSGIAAEEEINFRDYGADACIAKGTAENIRRHVLDLLREVDRRTAPADALRATLGADEIHTREVTRELLVSKRHYEAIVQQLADGILELTREGRIIYANAAAVELTGIREEKLLATRFRDLFPEEMQHRLTQALAAAGNGLLSINGEPPLMVNQSFVALTLLPVAGEQDLSIVVMMQDITRRVLDAKALNASETRFRELFDHMLAGVAVYESSNGREFTIVDFNRAAERIEQISREEVIGRTITEVFPGVEKFGLLDVMRRVWQSGHTEEHPLAFYQDERLTGWRENYLYKLPSGEVVAIYRDVTDQKKAEADLAFESEINEAVARLSQMLIAADSIADISSVLLEHAMKLTGSASGFVGYLDEHGQLQTLAMTTQPAAAPRKNKGRAFTIKGPEGLLGWVLENRECVMTNEPATDPRHSAPPPGHIPIHRFLAAPAMLGQELIGQVALANSDRDYTERDLGVVRQLASLYALAVDRQRSEEQIAHLADHDPLTGLANRRLLPDRLEQALRLARRHSTMVALLFMDLDKFKEINDTRGHSTGDEVLREVAARLAQTLRASDTIARMGGDEFVMVLQDIDGPDSAATVAGKLLSRLDQPLIALDGSATVRGSIGISLYPADGANGEILLQRADEAMYRAKQKGGGFAFFGQPS